MDNELFELCKEVYKRTEWEDTDYVWALKPYSSDDDYEIKSWESILKSHNGYFLAKTCKPLYTSDYLLEKLPRDLVTEDDHTYLCVNVSLLDKWAAYYGDAAGNKGTEVQRADTPLKALLKLAIALDDAGELSHV